MIKRPNVLWFCTDQQRFDTIGALGNPYVRTPCIDALAAGGTAFSTVYCQSPICTPSRVSFLTGMYPSAVHVNGNGNDYFPDHVPLVTKLMADADYTCGNVGKLHLASPFRREEPRADDGYTYFRYSHAPQHEIPQGHDYADWVHAQGHDLKALLGSPDGVPPELHQTTWAVERAIDFVRATGDRPWMLTVNVYDPHPPFDPPRSYRDMFDPARMPGPYFRTADLARQEALSPADFQSRPRRPEDLDLRSPLRADAAGEERADAKTLQAAYYAMIALIDDQFARLLRALDDTGQRADTIVIFTSDHGEMLGDHGLIQKGARFYEGLVRVPLIWSWPGRIREGVVSNALVELMDKAATILDFAGVPAPERMQARSLRPILEGRLSPDQHRDHVRSEYYDALNLPNGTLATMYRDRRYKIVNYHQNEFGELYDLDRDPWEFDNLWDSSEHLDLKLRLMKASFDASIRALDRGPPRIGPF